MGTKNIFVPRPIDSKCEIMASEKMLFENGDEDGQQMTDASLYYKLIYEPLA